MINCDLILSDQSLSHVELIQKSLLKSGISLNTSEIVQILLKYIVNDVDEIKTDEFLVIGKYHTENPSFFHSFYHDVMMSATFRLHN